MLAAAARKFFTKTHFWPTLGSAESTGKQTDGAAAPGGGAGPGGRAAGRFPAGLRLPPNYSTSGSPPPPSGGVLLHLGIPHGRAAAELREASGEEGSWCVPGEGSALAFCCRPCRGTAPRPECCSWEHFPSPCHGQQRLCRPTEQPAAPTGGWCLLWHSGSTSPGPRAQSCWREGLLDCSSPGAVEEVGEQSSVSLF